MDSWPLWMNAAALTAMFVLIAVGAKTVVDSATSLAEHLGVSELVIGLTVVAMGTSLPELGVTVMAALQGRSAISIGNVVGSNIFNLGFILGGAALVRAIPTDTDLVWRDGLVLVASTLLLLVLIGRDLTLSHLDGAILLAALAGYMTWLWKSRRAHDAQGARPRDRRSAKGVPWRDAAVLLVGLGVIVLSSELLIRAATAIARGFGMSEWVIAVTIVAGGTSVPELATTLAGVARGRMALSAGNVIGSDILNQLGVLGVAGVLRTMHLQAAAQTSLAALAGMAIIVVLMMRTGWRLSRTEGFLLLLLGMLRWGLDFATRL